MSQNLVETCPLASSQLLKPLPTRPQNPLGKICVKCVSAVFNPCRVAGTTFNALLLLWARWRPRTCVVGRSGCARARQSHCAWPASCAFLSAHAPPPHKLLSSSGARRLQLISWSYSVSHCNMQCALIPLESLSLYLGLVQFFEWKLPSGTTCTISNFCRFWEQFSSSYDRVILLVWRMGGLVH